MDAATGDDPMWCANRYLQANTKRAHKAPCACFFTALRHQFLFTCFTASLCFLIDERVFALLLRSITFCTAFHIVGGHIAEPGVGDIDNFRAHVRGVAGR